MIEDRHLTCGFDISTEHEHDEEIFSLLVPSEADEPITSCGTHLTPMLPLGVDVVVRREK